MNHKMTINWSENNNYLKGILNNSEKLNDPIRIAGFDLDDTIIHKPSGRSGAKLTKWKLVNMDLISKIKSLVKHKYIIIIFTNQAGMTSKNFNKMQWRQAMNELVKFLFRGIPDFYVAVYVAKNYDMYRKPNLGMWQLMKSDLKREFDLAGKLKISKKSFFVGDAAGRISPSPYKKKLHPSSKTGDHSDSDRKFALNIGIDFMTPEDFMMNESPKMPFKLSGFDPKAYLRNLPKDSEYKFVPRTRELIIMVGPPGSGKTEFVNTYIVPNGYVHINQDTCKTKAKCLSMAEEAMTKHQSLVIDNTNPDIPSRMAYTSMAVKYKYKHIRCIILKTDIELAKHLANVRHLYSGGTVHNINPIVYHVYLKHFMKPQTEEHFDEIETVNFDFDRGHFKDPIWKKFFEMYTESLK